MTIVELIKAYGQDAPVGIVVSDARIERPGPTILYANPALAQMTGRDVDAIIGISPRFMQGRETRRATLDSFHSALAAAEPFHGFLTNYRSDGTKYLVEIDCRPLSTEAGTLTHFIAFEREVVRRLGRPTRGAAGRYEPKSVSNDLLTPAMRALNVFRSSF